MKSVLLGVAAALLLGACATYQWRHATRYDANFDEDSFQCKKEAAQAFPPLAGERTVRPPRFGPSWFCSPAGTRCSRTLPYWQDAETESYDINERARDDLYRSCLQARGWIRYRVE